jgi:hypothetical protein
MSELHPVRALIERGETAQAAHRALDLGMLLRELFDVMVHNRKVLAWEKWSESGGKGPRRKPNPIILRYIKSRIRANRNLTEGDIWKELEQYDPIIQYENGSCRLFVDRGKLFARRGDKIYILERSSFTRYVTIARKEVDRPRNRIK